MIAISRANAVLAALLSLLFVVQPAQAKFEYVTPGHGKPLIVFIHGLWGDPTNSFKAEGSKKSWPLLMRDDDKSVQRAPPLKEYATATLSFPAWCADRLSITQIVTGLLRDLRDEEVWVNHPSIIFIGHSLGGLIAQELLALSRDRIDMVSMLERTAGLVLLATPTHGSDDASILAKALEQLPGAIPNCQLLRDLKSIDNNSLLQKLDEQWRLFIADQDEKKGPSGRLRVACLYETRPIWGRVIVSMQQAAAVCDGSRIAVNADHETIAKPLSHDSDVYRYVRSNIAEMYRMHSVRTAPLPPPPVPVPAERPKNKSSVVILGTIQMLPDTYVKGKGYRTVRNTDWIRCSLSCESDPQCRMIEFYKPDRECNLYNHSAISGRSRAADVGLKRGAGAEEGAVVAPFIQNMIRRPGMYIPGDGYRTIKGSSQDQCQTACASESRCLSWEYYAPTGNCGLFAHRDIRVAPRPGAHVGEKVKVAN